MKKKKYHTTRLRKNIQVGTPLFWYFPTRTLYDEDGTKYLRILYVGLYQTIDKHHIGGISTTMYQYRTSMIVTSLYFALLYNEKFTYEILNFIFNTKRSQKIRRHLWLFAYERSGTMLYRTVP